MANTIQLRRGTSDVALSGGSATVANTGEPVVFLPSSGDQNFTLRKVVPQETLYGWVHLLLQTKPQVQLQS